MRELSMSAFHIIPALISSLTASLPASLPAWLQADSIFDASSSMEGALKWETVVRGMESVYPLLQNAVAVLVCYWIAVLIPMSMFRRTHRLIAGTLRGSSIFIGVVCWLHCVAVTYRLLGWVVTAMGLL